MGEKIFLALLETGTMHANRSREAFQSLNLTDGQPKILYILYQSDGYVQKELAERCKVRPSTMTVILDKMEQGGLLCREKVQVSGGKRAYRVFLTEKGKAMAKEVVDIVECLEEISLKGMSEEEIAQLFSLLARVRDNLKE